MLSICAKAYLFLLVALSYVGLQKKNLVDEVLIVVAGFDYIVGSVSGFFRVLRFSLVSLGHLFVESFVEWQVLFSIRKYIIS
jgi:hypothetical protein